jgi:hypothetical protein
MSFILGRILIITMTCNIIAPSPVIFLELGISGFVLTRVRLFFVRIAEFLVEVGIIALILGELIGFFIELLFRLVKGSLLVAVAVTLLVVIFLLLGPSITCTFLSSFLSGVSVMIAFHTVVFSAKSLTSLWLRT